MSDFIHRIHPDLPNSTYTTALNQLQVSELTLIAHLDAGLAPHPTFGTGPDGFPANILIGQGRNVFDPGGANGDRPIAPLTSGPGLSGWLDYPDHGVKTLSVILGQTDRLRGMAQGVRVVPYRVSNGPLFHSSKGGPFCRAGETRHIGEAIDHALALPTVPAVVSISMGNPGLMDPITEAIRQALGGEVGMPRETGAAVDRAYEAGLIVVCAGGQISESVVYPARYDRTIGVGGFDRHEESYTHYPPTGYDRWEAIDVWAQAERINRASFDLSATPPAPVHAEDPNGGGEPSGTSYACPQVAVAAALWREKYRPELTRDGFAAARWKVVEAFRSALKSSSKPRLVRLPGNRKKLIRVLDVPRLLDTKPRLLPDSARRPKAEGQGHF